MFAVSLFLLLLVAVFCIGVLVGAETHRTTQRGALIENLDAGTMHLDATTAKLDEATESLATVEDVREFLTA